MKYISLSVLLICAFSLKAQNAARTPQIEIQAGALYQKSKIHNAGPPNYQLGGYDPVWGYDLGVNYIRPFSKYFSFQGRLNHSLQGRTSDNTFYEHYFLGADAGLRGTYRGFSIYSLFASQYMIHDNDFIYKFNDEVFQARRYDFGVKTGLSIPVWSRVSIFAEHTRMFTPYNSATIGSNTYTMFRRNTVMGLKYSFGR